MIILDHLASGASPERALILVLALALEALAGIPWGPFAWLPHPVRIIGSAIGFLEIKLNRLARSARDRRIRGVVVVGLLCGASGGLAWVLHRVAGELPFAWLIELCLVVSLLAQRSLFVHVRDVAVALGRRGLAAGREAVSRIVGRDVQRLDAAGVARAAIESCAENFSDGVVAPVFWYMLFGLPGLVIYKTVNTMDSMIGHRTARYEQFGWAAARLDDALNWVPARISGLLIILAAVLVRKTDPIEAFKVMRRDAGKHRSPNAGWPESAMAGALGLALAGPRRYGSLMVNEPWIGHGSAQATVQHVVRALKLLCAAYVVNAGVVAAMALVEYGLW